jgi:carbamoyl-phosphate synthase large subunit
MKSVGEADGDRRTFKEAFLKAVRSLELGKSGSLFPSGPDDTSDESEDETALRKRLVVPTIAACGRSSGAAARMDDETLYELTKIDPWFLQQFAEIEQLRSMAALGELRDIVAGSAAHAQAQRLRRCRHRGRVRRQRGPRAPAASRRGAGAGV